jgi:hypothetical protein
MNLETMEDLIKDFANCLIYAKDKGLDPYTSLHFCQAVITAEASKKADAPAGPDLVVKPVPLVSKTPMVQPAVVKASVTELKDCPRCHNMIPKWFKYHQDCGWTE